MMYDFSVEEMFGMPTMGKIQSEGDSRKVDRELLSQNSSKATFREDLGLIDIESLFDDEPKYLYNPFRPN